MTIDGSGRALSDEGSVGVGRYSSHVKDYDAAFAAVKAGIVAKFYGPAHTGVYSPSVQFTLMEMAKEIIATCDTLSALRAYPVIELPPLLCQQPSRWQVHRLIALRAQGSRGGVDLLQPP